MAFTYFISFDNGVNWLEFYPTVNPKITWTRHGDDLFYTPVIEEIQISQYLNYTVYATIAAGFFMVTGDVIQFKIKRNGTDTFYFRTKTNEGSLNTQNKIYKVTPVSDDDYRDILDRYDHQYFTDEGWIFSHTATVTIRNWQRPTASFTDNNFGSFSDTDDTDTTDDNPYDGYIQWAYNHLINDPVVTATYSLPSNAILGDQVRVVIRTTVTAGITVALINSIGTIVSNVENVADGMITLTATGTANRVEIKYTGVGATVNGSFYYDIYSNGTTHYGATLKDFIDTILSDYMGLTVTCKSTYLFNDAVSSDCPSSIDTYMTANPTHNYVTQATNLLTTLHVADARRWVSTYDQLTTITLKNILDILKYKLRAFLYIDADGYLRIEHEMYFRSWTSQLDLTSNTYAKYKPEIDSLIYSYEKSDNYSQINYRDNQASGWDFRDITLQYDINKTSEKTRDVTVDVVTDVDSISGTFGGLLLISTEIINSVVYVKIADSMKQPGYYVNNEELSWRFLFDKYWTYFGEADMASFDTEVILMTHTKELLKQINIKSYYNGILSAFYPLTLTQGTAWIDKMTLDLDTGFYTFDVGYDPYNTVFITDESDILLTDEDGNLITE